MIVDEAKGAREKLARLVAAISNVEEAVALSTKKNDLSVLADKLSALAVRRKMLREAGVPLTESQDLDKAKHSCSTLLNRFTESPKSATLVDKQRWTKFSELISNFNHAEDTLQKQDWKSFFGTRLFAGVSPEQREQTILLTLPENKDALDRYRRLYKQLSVYKAVIPVNESELSQALECSRQLSEIRFIENKDVPSSVREFFNATSSENGAGLNLLTSEVVEWLSSNDMLSNFAVRAR